MQIQTLPPISLCQSQPFSKPPNLDKSIHSSIPPAMEVDGGGGGGDGVSVSVAVVACTGMTVFYVAILYSPTFILRLPPPASFKSFMIRRFVCAAISSLLSLIICALILPVKSWEASYVFSAFGIRLDHVWEAVVHPLFLTSLMYVGSFVSKFFSFWSLSSEQLDHQIDLSFDGLKSIPLKLINWMSSLISNISAWRIYFVGPLTEELVFRACMIPLLLCGGFKPYTIIFLAPVFFSLGHLHHLLEQEFMVVGFQLSYTLIFGSYASFLFIRTGHLTAPLMSHMFCNYMGIPKLFSRETGLVSVGFGAGAVGFVYLLFPLTSPDLYNDTSRNCKCWQGYCGWTT